MAVTGVAGVNSFATGQGAPYVVMGNSFDWLQRRRIGQLHSAQVWLRG